jgi:integrase
MNHRQQRQQQRTGTSITSPQQEWQVYKVDEGIPSPNTRLRYRSAFSLFLRHCRQTDLYLLIQQNPRNIEAQIIDYINFLFEEKHYARGSICAAVSTILHFFEMNDIILNKKKLSRFLPEDVSDHTDRAYMHEEIQQMLQRCDQRSRVIILLMASTGMRIGAIPVLQIGHLEKIVEHNLYKITVYANFPRAKYYTFCTPEAATAIDSYLAYRRRFMDPLNKTSPLVREQFEIDDPSWPQIPDQ